MRTVAKLTPLGLLLSAPAAADPGLGSLEGLWVVYLIGLGILLLGLILLFFLARAGFRLVRSGDAQDKATGRGILAVLALLAIVTTTRFTDFHFYLLMENTYPDAVTITKAHVERYMETDDGRAFYLSDMGLSYFKPGRSVVLRPDPYGVMRVNDIFEASRSMYHRLADKKFWIPIIPVKKTATGYKIAGPSPYFTANGQLMTWKLGPEPPGYPGVATRIGYGCCWPMVPTPTAQSTTSYPF